MAVAARHTASAEAALLAILFVGGGGQRGSHRHAAALRAAAALALTVLAVGLIGRLAGRPRPFVTSPARLSERSAL